MTQAAVGVPASLHSSLLARLDRLGPAREVAPIGAVIGREFDYELLRAVAMTPGADLASALDLLCDAGLVLRRGHSSEARFLFKHALVQDAAYGSLLRADRRDVHRRIAEALEAHFSEMADIQPELLAHHFTEAELAEPAVRYWLRAGQQALKLSGMVEAAALLNKGLGLIPKVPDSIQRQEQELDLQIASTQRRVAFPQRPVQFDMYVEDEYATFVRYCFEDPLDAAIFRSRIEVRAERLKLAG
jgi:predicted ATPase